MVTLKDIAKECNVSFSTVSKALQGSKEISAETIKIIQKKAEQMGYHPNIAARTLRTNRTYDIGVIFEDKTGSGFQHQYFAKIISGLQNIAQSHNYDVTFTGPAQSTDYDYYKHIIGKSFDGIAILSADFNRKDLQQLVKSDIPTATLDYNYGKNHISILSNNEKGIKELTDFVIAKGHKKIALIYGENTLVTKERKQFFIENLAKHNIEVPSEYFIEARYHDMKKSQQATEKLLNLPNPPTCIFYPDDYSALGGLQILNKRNLVPGKDISIVGYDGIMLTSLLIPPLTTYEQDGVTIGEKMAEFLIKQIEESKKSEYVPYVVSGKLIEGGTVQDLNSSR